MVRSGVYKLNISGYRFKNSLYPVIFSLFFLFVSCLPGLAMEKEPTQIEIRDTLPNHQTRYLYLKKQLILEFDLVIQPGQTYFGQILQIQSNDNEYYNFFLDDQENLSQLLVYSKKSIQKLQLPISGAYSPMQVKLNFFQQRNDFTIQLNDTSYVVDNLGFKSTAGYKFLFTPIEKIGTDLSGKPVFQIENIRFIEITDTKLSGTFWYWFVFVLVIDLLFFGIIQLRKRYLRRKHQAIPESGTSIEVISSDIELPPVSAVYLFGGFHIYDRDGQNITKKFTPLLKELFLLLILHTPDKGISSGKLKDILWFDKTDQSAKNNRTVNFGKLRGLLDTIGVYDLNNNTGNWILDIKDQTIYVDYFEYIKLYAKGDLTTREDILKLLKLIRRGSFLNDVGYEWLDRFKNTISDYVIDTLLQYAETLNTSEDPDLILQIAEAVSAFDVLNESALQLRVKAYTLMGKHATAKNSYEKFSKEYLAIYGEKFPRSLSDLR